MLFKVLSLILIFVITDLLLQLPVVHVDHVNARNFVLYINDLYCVSSNQKTKPKKEDREKAFIKSCYMSFLYMECTSIQFVVTCNIWFEISFSLSTFWSEPMCF
jgi:hypothetical protein